MFDSTVKPEINNTEYDIKRKAAYSLNCCLISITQIIDYNDIYVVKQEFDNILNNLNLQNYTKDEALLDVYKQTLETAAKCIVSDKQKSRIEEKYQQQVKDAIWTAVPNITVIFSGGTPAAMAFAAITQIGAGYMNFRKNLKQYAQDKEEQEFQLEVYELETFQSLQIRMFETAWKMSEKFDFDDILKVTAKQVSEFNEILLDSNPHRRYDKLDYMSENFLAFAPFWYHKGNAAKGVCFSEEFDEATREEYRQKALSAYRKFTEVYIDLHREDILAASCALEHISLLSFEMDREEIEKLLAKAIKYANGNYDILQMCVPAFITLGSEKHLHNAQLALKRLVNAEINLNMNGLMLSRFYYDNKDKSKYAILKRQIGEDNVVNWDTGNPPEPKGEEPGPKPPETIETMTKKAEKAVLATVTAAIAAAAVPIPLADAAMLVPIQVTMMASVAAIFKINIKENGLKTLAFAAFGVGGATFIGRLIVSNLLKLIPGVGWIVGGGISAAFAGLITHAMGIAFIELCKLIKRGELKEEDLTSREGTALFKKTFKSYMKTFSKNKDMYQSK